MQRVASASVTVEGERIAEIGPGLLILACAMQGDDAAAVARLAPKIAKLRIFEDDAGRMNLDVAQRGGAVLLVSQFTLCGDCSGGNRPSFVDAASPEVAEPLVEAVAHALRASHGLPVETGRFRTEMQVALVNDGPVTIVLRSPSAAT